MTQTFHHVSHGVVHPFGPIGHLYHNLLAVLRSVQLVQRYENVHHHGAAVANQESKAVLFLYDAHKPGAGSFQNLHHLSLGLVHLALGEHQHLHRIAVQGMVCVVCRYQHILAVLVLGYHIGLACLLHVDGAYQVVLGQQVVVDVLWVDFIFAAGVLVCHQYLGFGQFLKGGNHQLAASLVVGSHPRGNLFVVERIKRIIGKYL